MAFILERPPRREIQVARRFGWSLVAFAVLALLCSIATAQHCRISNGLAEFANMGSGTLIHKMEDGSEGLILTCAHLFTEGTGRINVIFPDHSTRRARLIKADYKADLATLAIASPTIPAAAVSFDKETHDRVTVCGFGGEGVFRQLAANRIGYEASEGAEVLVVDAEAIEGDSGGGIFNSEGDLVAVTWGATKGKTYATTGEALESFLSKALGPRLTQCVNGRCYRPTYTPARPARVLPAPAVAVPAAPVCPAPACGCKSRFTAIEARLKALESAAAIPGPAGPPGPPGPPGFSGRDGEVDPATLDAAIENVVGNLRFNEPFYIRVHPEAEYQPVKPGQYVTIPLQEILEAQ